MPLKLALAVAETVTRLCLRKTGGGGAALLFVVVDRHEGRRGKVS